MAESLALNAGSGVRISEIAVVSVNHGQVESGDF